MTYLIHNPGTGEQELFTSITEWARITGGDIFLLREDAYHKGDLPMAQACTYALEVADEQFDWELRGA